jgi:hypothetical protein
LALKQVGEDGGIITEKAAKYLSRNTAGTIVVLMLRCK